MRVWGTESKGFYVRVGLRIMYVMFPWFFNGYMGGVVKEVNTRVNRKGRGSENDWEESGVGSELLIVCRWNCFRR